MSLMPRARASCTRCGACWATQHGGRASGTMWPRTRFRWSIRDDFRKAMEAASGKDLKWFFDQWVYKAGHPELKVRWHFEDADKTVRVRVQQTQTVDDKTPLFRLPTTLEITDDDGKTSVVPDRDRRSLARVRDPGRGQAQDGPDRPPGLADQGARLREIRRREPIPARACRVRAGAAGRRSGTRQDGEGQARGRQGPWPRPGSAKKPLPPSERCASFSATATKPSARRLIEAASDSRSPDPRGRDRGSRQAQTRRCDRDDSSVPPGPIPKKPMVLAKPPCGDWLPGKSKTSTSCWQTALKVSADHHSIAAIALSSLLETPGAKSRELAVLYSEYGQPKSLQNHGPRGILSTGQGRPDSPGCSGRAGRRPRPLGAVSGLDGRGRARR